MKILDFPPWVALAFCVCLIPIISFAAYKLYCFIQTFIFDRRSRRKSSSPSVGGIGNTTATNVVVPEAAEKVSNVMTVDRKEIGWDAALRQNSLLKMTAFGNKWQQSLEATREETPPKPKLSACCVHEEELLGLGPMPFDISIVEAERQKEVEKLQRAPEEPPVARILSVSSRQQTQPPSTPQQQ